MARVEKGDRIRILQSGLHCAQVLDGDVLEVTGRVMGQVFATESPRNLNADGWWFKDGDEGEGWERVVQTEPSAG